MKESAHHAASPLAQLERTRAAIPFIARPRVSNSRLPPLPTPSRLTPEPRDLILAGNSRIAPHFSAACPFKRAGPL